MDVFYEESPYKELKVNANCENESFEYLREFFIKQAMQFERLDLAYYAWF